MQSYKANAELEKSTESVRLHHYFQSERVAPEIYVKNNHRDKISMKSLFIIEESGNRNFIYARKRSLIDKYKITNYIPI